MVLWDNSLITKLRLKFSFILSNFRVALSFPVFKLIPSLITFKVIILCLCSGQKSLISEKKLCPSLEESPTCLNKLDSSFEQIGDSLETFNWSTTVKMIILFPGMDVNVMKFQERTLFIFSEDFMGTRKIIFYFKQTSQY